MKATIEKVKGGKGEELVIRYPLNGHRPSSSGKMQLIASTGGFKETDQKYTGGDFKDRTVFISVNAGFYPTDK